MMQLDSYYLIFDSIDNVKKIIEKLPYLNYAISYQTGENGLPDIVYIGFETSHDTKSFLSLADNLKDIEPISEESYRFEFTKEIVAISIQGGTPRILKHLSVYSR